MICSMGVLAGSRAWLWMTRILLAILALIAAVSAGGRWGASESFVILDDLWSISLVTLRATLAISATAAVVLAIFIGRPVRAA